MIDKRNCFEFVTDTATLVVFDLQSLKHRLNDDADWWSIKREELLEMNAGNVVVFNLKHDGRYVVTIGDFDGQNGWISCNLRCPIEHRISK